MQRPRPRPAPVTTAVVVTRAAYYWIETGAHVDTPAPSMRYGRFCSTVVYVPLMRSIARTVELGVPPAFVVVTNKKNTPPPCANAQTRMLPRRPEVPRLNLLPTGVPSALLISWTYATALRFGKKPYSLASLVPVSSGENCDGVAVIVPA